jgi:hypothetical protein
MNNLTRIIYRWYNTTIPSDLKMVGVILEERGFHWKQVEMEKVQSNSHSVSFATEWKKLMDCISAITETNPAKTTTDEGLSWEHFKKVINPGPDHVYKTESAFSDSLFVALRASLNDFIVPTVSDANQIALKNSPIRFGRGISRATLGFPANYGLSQDSISDHSCFVVGSKATSQNQQENDGISSDMKKENVFWHNDLTAVVEIKLGKTSCKSFAVDSDNFVTKPDLKELWHAPIGQAMLYTLDVLHCLARRGQNVTSLLVVVLAGKSDEGSDKGQVCCLEARIDVPEYAGDEFKYSVDRVVCFDGTTGPGTNETCSEDVAASLMDSRDERAIAIYIRTLRIGLEHAVEVIKNRNTSDSVSPVSLCCQRLLPGKINAQLIASPIPREDHQSQSGLRISQGELFQLVSPTKKSFSKLIGMIWFAKKMPKHCLVKVSCASVHSTTIHHTRCFIALHTLHVACMRNKTLKNEISKVLLGFCYRATSESLVTVMEDLQAGEKNFKVLDHQKLQSQGKLPQLWSAFCVLVQSLLLPMADVNVIHWDIRSDKIHTYNILVDENPADGCGYPTNTLALHLIDFDSLVVCGTTIGTRQDYAVYMEDLKKFGAGKSESAHRYLLWQVLWIAYTWHPLSSLVSRKPPQQEMKASTFLCSLFDDNYYLGFKYWLGIETVEALKTSLSAETITAKIIGETLAILQNAFCDKSNA